MMMDNGFYVNGCFGDMDSCKNKGTYHCDACSRKVRFIDDYYDRYCPNCHSDFVDFHFTYITDIPCYEKSHVGVDGRREKRCPICDDIYMRFIKTIKDKNGIVSFVKENKVPVEIKQRYKFIVYADDYPDIFERENLYLSFR